MCFFFEFEAQAILLTCVGLILSLADRIVINT